jgi:hypothetical protein
MFIGYYSVRNKNKKKIQFSDMHASSDAKILYLTML